MKQQKKTRYIALSAAAVVVLVGVGASTYWWGEYTGQQSANTTQHDVVTTAEIRESLLAVDAEAVTKDTTMTQTLHYLIEEEKLAHDVYQTLYDQWGYRTFGNIKQSELSHQSNVLAVMEVRDIADPRSDTIGVFVNADLQALYDTLVAQGARSAEDALKAGVAIEERDIKDLQEMISTIPSNDTDVKAMMERLLEGSQRHLSAFTRQLTKT